MKFFLGIILSLEILAFGHGSAFNEPFESVSNAISAHWTRIGRVDPDSTIDLIVVLSNPNSAALEDRAMQIATPFSGYYRKHLSAAELAEWVRPSVEAVKQVQSWLSAFDIKTAQSHDLLEAQVPVSKVEALLNTKYYLYQNDHGAVVKRTEYYHVPNDVAELIEFIHPTVNFPSIKRKKSAPAVDDSGVEDEAAIGLKPVEESSAQHPCSGFYITPKCIAHYYNVTYAAPVGTNVSVAAFLLNGGNYNETNLQHYLQHFNPPAAKAHAKPTEKHLGPPSGISITEDEQDTDIQTILGNAWPVKCSYNYFSDNEAAAYAWGPFYSYPHHKPPKKIHQYEEHYLKYIHSFTHQEFVPSAATQSELEVEHYLTAKYLRYLCRIYGQIGARGVSIFFPSGDYGSNAIKVKGKEQVPPWWPAGCPFVTAVGGTTLVKGIEEPTTYATRKYQGAAANWYASGGGFSNVFPVPKYQHRDVTAYRQAHHLRQKFGNITYFGTGRGYPDIAFFAQRVPLFSKGKVQQGSGTSASSPGAAALIARLNAREQSRGRPPIGFLNPWLYMNPDLLTDLTRGGTNEPISFKTQKPQGHGYPVAKGWDAVSGLGSFRFDKMLKSLDDMAAAGALG